MKNRGASVQQTFQFADVSIRAHYEVTSKLESLPLHLPRSFSCRWRGAQKP
jgi:hypothetical protein